MTESGIFTRFHGYDFTNDDRFQSGLGVMRQHDKGDGGSWLLRAKIFYYNKFVEPLTLEDYLKEYPDSEDLADQLSSSLPDTTTTYTEDGPPDKLMEEASLEDVYKLAEDVSTCVIHEEDVSEEQTDSKPTGPCNVEQNDQTNGQKSTPTDVLACDDKVDNLEGDDDTVLNKSESGDKNGEITIIKNDGDPVISDYKAEDDSGTSLTFSQIVEYIQRGEKIPGVQDLNIEPTNLTPTQSSSARKAKPWENTVQS